MAWSPSPSSFCELDAGSICTTLSLTSPFTSLEYQWEVDVGRLSAFEGRVRIVERETRYQYNTRDCKEKERSLDLSQDPVVLTYTTDRSPTAAWNVQVGFERGGIPQMYPFQTREDAFRFQQLVTRYEVIHRFENVRVTVAAKKRGRFSLRLQQEQYVGTGEVQLWWPEELSTGPASKHSSPCSQLDGVVNGKSSPPSTRFTSFQPNQAKGNNVVVRRRPQPPLLVAFVRNDVDDGYTMIKSRRE
jgi:hypothetical protein